MSKPITMTPKMAEEFKTDALAKLDEVFDRDAIVKEIEDAIASAKMNNGKIKIPEHTFKFDRSYIWKDDKARVKIIFSADAYAKIVSIVLSQTDEVAWHGIVDRRDDHTFYVSDIIIYPQIVTGSTVNSDPATYSAWLNQQPDEIYSRIRFHGHSHVHMQVQPSGTDMEQRNDITQQLSGDAYYIFMIINKRHEWSGVVYDMKRNTLYESSDIDIDIEFSDGTTKSDLLTEVGEKVQKYQYKAAAKQGTDKKKEGENTVENNVTPLRGTTLYPPYDKYAETGGLGGTAGGFRFQGDW